MQLEIFNQKMSDLAEFFRSITEKQLRFYWQALKEFSDETFEKGVSRIIRSKSPGGFFPSINEIELACLGRNIKPEDLCTRCGKEPKWRGDLCHICWNDIRKEDT